MESLSFSVTADTLILTTVNGFVFLLYPTHSPHSKSLQPLTPTMMKCHISAELCMSHLFSSF